jgi:hypothetical protein
MFVTPPFYFSCSLFEGVNPLFEWLVKFSLEKRQPERRYFMVDAKSSVAPFSRTRYFLFNSLLFFPLLLQNKLPILFFIPIGKMDKFPRVCSRRTKSLILPAVFAHFCSTNSSAPKHAQEKRETCWRKRKTSAERV